MQTLIASDDQATAEKLRAALRERGIDCPMERMLSLDASGALVAGRTWDPELVLIVISADIDRALGLVAELRLWSKARVVVVGSARDPQVILRAVHAGPDDYLDIDGDYDAELQRALGRMKAGSRAGDGEGRLITFVSHSGGSGCSFLAANLAVALAGEHGRAALCDFNVRRGDLATLLNVKPRFSISDLTRNLTKLDQNMFEQALLAHESGVHVLAAPASLTDVHPITSDAADHIVRLARASFPYVIADLEDFFHAEQFHLIKASHQVLFVLRLDFTALRNARRTLEYLEREGLDTGRVHMVVNKYGRSRELAVREAETVLGRKLSLFVPYDPKTAVSSVNRGVPVMCEAPRSKIGRAVRKIAELVSHREAVTA